MTSPAPSGGPSRRRVAGLALVGVGVIAAIIGLASLALDNGGDGQTAAPPPGGETATTAPAPPPGAAPTTIAPPATTNPIAVPTFPTSAVPAPPPPATAAPAPAPGGEQGGAGSGGSGGGTDASGSGSGGSGGAGSGVSRGPVRVYNNSTITGLAAGAAEDLRKAGWEVGEVANYPFGIIRTTTAYYRPGTAEKATAEELGREFGMRVSERFEGLEDASPGVIVIVTNDYQGL
ncbi:LytR C-terminal domain-containing protein [Pseudonocardia humida]|uniref:LytR C-terminal domain-containing protein n=1 Tax=Pseudonocardia humida TaxID=2800819 RepID=A0ABT1AB58_9PSEU|nr:LytR C-terminal domain-containing protein [Pseudonocardia humida]MCO1660287.1 LytR C-terminal domain-containing protein [Pseudonocardia humida]